MSRRSFTPLELATAIRMRGRGASWRRIAKAIHRADSKGIRCRLDPEARARHNAYHAGYKRERRASERDHG